MTSTDPPARLATATSPAADGDRTSAADIRPFTLGDVPQLLELMKALAVLEDYIDDFQVTETALVERGLGAEPQFHALVAVDPQSEGLLGMAVAYFVQFTWDLQPTLYLKEMFVRDGARGRGIGRSLFVEMARFARSRGAGALRWMVLAGNEEGVSFYRSLGARHDSKWHPWLLDGPGLDRLLLSREI